MEITVTQVAVIFVRIVVSPAMIASTVLSPRRGIHNLTMPVLKMVMPTVLCVERKIAIYDLF
jgi:hypothetical protein